MIDHLTIAVGDEGVERLRREAAVLSAIRHPGIVELLGFTDEGGVAELRTAEVDGPPLAAGDPLADGEIAGLAAAVATTLADLHDAGIVHGALDGGHVLLGSTGPVLCGFDASGPPAQGRQPADDVAALGALVLELVDRGPVAEVARGLTGRTAREAAAAFRACVATAVLPGRTPTGEDTDALSDLLGRGHRQWRRRPARRWLMVGPVVIVVIVGFALLTPRHAPAPVTVSAPSTTGVPPTTTPPAPTATLVWPPVTGPAPTFMLGERRYTAGAPGDVVLVGPFGCNGSGGSAAVLRPESGRVFLFTEVASVGHDTTAAEVATVVGGRGLRSDDADGDGCIDLLVERAGGAAPVPVALAQGATP
jgi:serine/threonine protein kinase